MPPKFLFAGVLILCFINCSAPKQEKNEAIVTVGSSKLTLDILRKEIPDMLQGSVTKDQINNYVQQWIESELLYQSALKLGLDLDQDFRYDMEKAKKELLVRRYLNKLLEKEAQIADTEIEKYYNENKDDFVIGDDEIKALHILVATQQEADDVRARLMRGEDFLDLAKEVSLDYERNKRIGLGFFSKNDVVPDIAARVFSFRVGNISPPIKSDFGWHIFKILEKRPKGYQEEIADVKENIISRLASMKKAERYSTLLAELKSKTDIKINDNNLKEIY